MFLTDHLYSVFGGRDNLRLMCNIEQFYENEERGFIRFSMEKYHIWLVGINQGYMLLIYDREIDCMLVEKRRISAEQVREAFTLYTGCSLSF